jgi:hypothetical protein
MAVEFRRAARLDFDPTSGQEQVLTGTVTFSQPVTRADAAIHGFDIGYTDGDHHVLRAKLDVSNVQIDQLDSQAVRFDVRYLFRDSSGNIDDRFNGWVDVLVFAVTEARRPVAVE